jgi:exodeoxyribonuclease VII large subunit
VLSRGYAIATDAAGRAIREHGDVAPGDRVEVRVHRGALLATVVATAAPGEGFPGEGGGGPPPGRGQPPGRGRAPAPARRRRAGAPAAQLGLDLDRDGQGTDG